MHEKREAERERSEKRDRGINVKRGKGINMKKETEEKRRNMESV